MPSRKSEKKKREETLREMKNKYGKTKNKLEDQFQKVYNTFAHLFFQSRFFSESVCLQDLDNIFGELDLSDKEKAKEKAKQQEEYTVCARF